MQAVKNKSLKEGIRAALNKEKVAKGVFIGFAAFSIIAVFAIILYIFLASLPAFKDIGFFNFIFGTEWYASAGKFGILPMILTSTVLTLISVALGGTLAVFTAVYMVYYCPKRLKGIYVQVINLLSGIPSLIFGYFGLVMLKPAFEKAFGLGSSSGLLLSSVILAIMILPTVTSLVKNSLESVPMNYYEGALALGCTKNQTVFKVCLPAAKNGVIAAFVLGIGRAVGETMAVQLLLGNQANFPTGLFVPVKSLTSNIVQEFGYSTGLHRQALIATGFVLLLFILIINLALWAIKKNDKISGNRMFSRKLKESEGAISKFSYHKTGSAQDALWIISCVVAVIVAAILIFLIAFVLANGISNISIEFLFGQSGNRKTTLLPAFVSTGMLVLLALLIALPLGIGAAIYLTEYAKRGSKFVKIIRLFIDTLAGIPSIVFGLFGAIFFGEILGMGYSLLNGGITLSLIILPTIIRATEQSLSEVPDSMREASLALGASKVRTIFCVVLPQAVSGVITSIILSIGRIVGESAALIYTAGSVSTMPSGYGSAGSTFAVMMYKFMSEGLQIDNCYATAAVLMIFVIIINIAVTLVEKFFKKKV
ncbi:MAG: phosphate ABC transporter permease PstA [Clostridia bacterium]|nr:phosphate ABC transporter permease PstA [Clostridia bacterium]